MNKYGIYTKCDDCKHQRGVDTECWCAKWSDFFYADEDELKILGYVDEDGNLLDCPDYYEWTYQDELNAEHDYLIDKGERNDGR